MRVKYILKTNDYLTNGKIYEAQEVQNPHGPVVIYGLKNDEGDFVTVAADAFEVIED